MTLNREDLALLLDLVDAAVVNEDYAGEPAKEARAHELRFRIMGAMENWTWNEREARWTIK